MNHPQYDKLHFEISHERAWRLFKKPEPVENVGKISKTKFLDRTPPEGARLALSYLGQSINPKNNYIDLVWWREKDKQWVYITTITAPERGPFNIERLEYGHVWDSIFVTWDYWEAIGEGSGWTDWQRTGHEKEEYRIVDNNNKVL